MRKLNLQEINLISKERMQKLMILSIKKELTNDKKNSIKYLQLIKKISKKTQVKFLKNIQYCKTCEIPFISGYNSRTRIRNEKLIVTCFYCQKIFRFKYKPNNKKKV